MNVTGKIYTQIYSPTGQRFVELNSGYAITIGARRATDWSITPNLTGYNFPLPIVVSRIEAMPIAIGARITSGSGAYSVNIGMFSSTALSPGYATSGYIGGFNFGASNYSIDGLNVYNYGADNQHNQDEKSFNIGFQNSITGSKNILSEGMYNFVDKSDFLKILGKSNLVQSGRNLYVVGSNNTLTDLNNTNVVGDLNNIALVNSSEVFGKINIINGMQNNGLSVFGDTNTITYSDLLDIFGSDNLVLSSSGNYIFGNLNSLTNASLALIVGNNNSSTDINNSIFGLNNSVAGENSSVYGNGNFSYSNTSDNFIFGSANTVTGATFSTILGSQNTLTRELVNVHDTSTSDSNLVLGRSNTLSSISSSHILGANNEANFVNNNFIIGNQNISENSSDSYVFGDNNNVSGERNYIIGNNNDITSGNYNSIFIGISSQFTGNKTSSINIAAANSNIEVNPSQIKLRSSNRPQINDNNIVIESDLNNLVAYNDALTNSGVFFTNSFQDNQYNRLSDKLELSSFVYSGREDRYSGGFIGSGSNYTYNMSGFFRKVDTANYSGLYNVFGNYFYQSNDFKFNALFSRHIEPLTGNWIITKTYNLDSGSNDGVFYFNRSSNSQLFPTGEWLPTGYKGLTGSALTNPSFVYTDSFTGKFQQKVLDSNSSVGTNYFTSFAEKMYSSNEDGISVIYGNLNLNSPLASPAWMIVDNFSSGIYYINRNYSSTSLPQTGWRITGWAGYSGMINTYVNSAPRLQNATGINIVVGSRQGYIPNSSPSGRIYIPFYY